MDEHEAEIRKVRQQLTVVAAEARANEGIYRRARARDMQLLQAGTLAELFGAMVPGLRADYGLDAVTLVIRDLQHEIRQLIRADDPHAAEAEGVQYVETLEGYAPQYNTLWQPWLGPYIGADHSLIFPGRHELRSCALLPLRRHGELIGCLNLASGDPVRFTRHHGFDFLAHTADVAAVCLENAVNRARLVRSGITDVLTGLYNRRYLQHRLADELARARRDGRPLGCVLVDVDHFKRVNDQWGHPAGDAVLEGVAHLIREECRDSDIPVRYGGEEFALLLPGADEAEAAGVAERVRSAVEQNPATLPNGAELSLTVSAGVASVAPGPAVADLKSVGDRLIAEADVQLYRAKSDGRNRVRRSAA
jgi:diguanylate cyclase (GGDEF)-like protein